MASFIFHNDHQDDGKIMKTVVEVAINNTVEVVEVINSVLVNNNEADVAVEVFMALTFIAIITINVPIIR